MGLYQNVQLDQNGLKIYSPILPPSQRKHQMEHQDLRLMLKEEGSGERVKDGKNKHDLLQLLQETVSLIKGNLAPKEGDSVHALLFMCNVLSLV